jgi:hypothetical protein
MPEKLAEYWVHGKGALKIRWGTPGDFNRCVRNLRKYFPRNPEGLCNRLHTRALGVAPGQEHALDLEYFALLDGFKTITTDERRNAAGKGQAMPDGSYPIRSVAELRDAIQAVGRAKDPAAVRKHIMKRARALGHPEMIPEQWLKRGGKASSLDEITVMGDSEFEAFCGMDDEVMLGGYDPEGMDVDDALYDDEQALVPMKDMWRGRLAPIGVPTGDRRRFAVGGIGHRELPLPLLYQRLTGDGHAQSVVVGRILGVQIDDAQAYGYGDWLDVPEKYEAQQMLSSGVGGVSVDLDDVEYELRVPGTDQKWLEAEQCNAADGSCTTHEFVVTQGRIAGATIVAIPAFAEAKLEMYQGADEEGLLAAFDDKPMTEPECGCGISAGAHLVPQHALVAAAVTSFTPPAAAFNDPRLPGVTGLTLDPDRYPGYIAIYGHCAPWNLPHVGVNRTAPHSRTGYAYFHVGEIYTAEGNPLAVGKVVYAGKHPGLDVGMRAAVAHYDDTSKAVAVVRAGEDAYGIWVAGVLLPWVDETTRLDLALSPLSGDWRRVGGSYEMIAALAVNYPGFPVVRERVEGGKGVALIACAVAPVEDRMVTLHLSPQGRLYARDQDGEVIDLDLHRAQAGPDEARTERVRELYALLKGDA